MYQKVKDTHYQIESKTYKKNKKVANRYYGTIYKRDKNVKEMIKAIEMDKIGNKNKKKISNFFSILMRSFSKLKHLGMWKIHKKNL